MSESLNQLAKSAAFLILHENLERWASSYKVVLIAIKLRLLPLLGSGTVFTGFTLGPQTPNSNTFSPKTYESNTSKYSKVNTEDKNEFDAAETHRENYRLRDQNCVDLFSVNPDKYVTNLSDVTLSAHQKEDLSLGPNFCVPGIKFTDLSIYSESENLYDQLKPLVATYDEDRGWFEVKMVNIAHQFLNNNPKEKSNLSSQHVRACKELWENLNITIKKLKKVPESRDPSSEDIHLLQSTVTANPVKLLGLNTISKDIFDSLKPSKCKFPHMHGLPKTHKPNNPLRPILSVCTRQNIKSLNRQ
ncbi:unnamed protein product [Trichobilharzia regenti]|nr:unnamed protein product [Trichobilharzia regenti]